MNKTKIEWVKNPDGTQGYTWNPITGCLNHTNGLCKGGNFPCYAYRLANGRLRSRYLANTNFPCGDDIIPRDLDFLPMDEDNPFYPRFWPERLLASFNHNVLSGREKGIFVCDMGELFGDWIPRKWQDEVFRVIELFPEHRFYLLTKQPQNLIKFSPFPNNCWVGVTATSYDSFVDACGNLGALKHDGRIKMSYISLEPLLYWDSTSGFTLPWLMQGDIDWLIIGGKSGKDPFYPPWQWIGEIENAADKAGIPVFEKYNLRSEWPNLPRQEMPK